jgi:lipopolysaccharide biosynthesis regulator YciM
MPEMSPLTWVVGIGALVIGILAGHFGWGRRWPRSLSKLHPDYLAGLDYLVTEQPDRALDMFLKLMDADADTIETHFSLGSLYRRRGEVERAIRIHQNLLAREALAPEHREQALLALAQDYLRAGLLDRAEGLLRQVSEVPRLRASALDALRGVYERQHEWQQALDVHRLLSRLETAPPRAVAAHYLCELASVALEHNATDSARAYLEAARAEVASFPRAAVLGARIAEREGDAPSAVQLLKTALCAAPNLLQEELPNLLRLTAPAARDAVLEELLRRIDARDADAARHLAFAVLSADLAGAQPARRLIETVFADDPILHAVSRAAASPEDATRIAREVGALLAHAEKYRCVECGFSGRSFYWHCPACHAWDSFEPYALVKLG